MPEHSTGRNDRSLDCSDSCPFERCIQFPNACHLKLVYFIEQIWHGLFLQQRFIVSLKTLLGWVRSNCQRSQGVGTIFLPSMNISQILSRKKQLDATFHPFSFQEHPSNHRRVENKCLGPFHQNRGSKHVHVWSHEPPKASRDGRPRSVVGEGERY